MGPLQDLQWIVFFLYYRELWEAEDIFFPFNKEFFYILMKFFCEEYMSSFNTSLEKGEETFPNIFINLCHVQ